MITAYHRPKTLEEALELLTQPDTAPLGGGTLLSQPTTAPVSVVDLQLLMLDQLAPKGNDLEIGAVCALQTLYQSERRPEALKAAIQFEAPLNLRNSATVAGTIVAGDGRSPFVTMLLSMDAKITLQKSKTDSQTIGISEYILTYPKGLITAITLPSNVKTAFEAISKTPTDTPIVCAAMTQWNSGRTRLALGGYGKTPTLALDGTEAEGAEDAARNAYHEAGDEWASAEYRLEMAAILAKRCLDALK
ncbi:MAG: FAD binding domain-containing protein [Anaerolineales bacterium]|nr:FAD binding domain-containing protein [Anaerolineales bacterium]MCZ2122195.1 FAD binding domain-containing protein [Anaerolineales bacterium]